MRLDVLVDTYQLTLRKIGERDRLRKSRYQNEEPSQKHDGCMEHDYGKGGGERSRDVGITMASRQAGTPEAATQRAGQQCGNTYDVPISVAKLRGMSAATRLKYWPPHCQSNV